MTNEEKLLLAHKVMQFSDEPMTLLYALDLVLFGGQNIMYSATLDRNAKDLIIKVMLGLDND